MTTKKIKNFSLNSKIQQPSFSILHTTSPSHGQTLLPVLLFFILALIIVPYLIFQVRQEGLWTTKIKRSTTAFHLAEAGLDRGYWKLLESSDNFNNILEGQTIPLYDGTTTFTDLPGGEYKIWITSTGNANEVKILSVGRDTTKNEIRAIEAIYFKDIIETTIQTGAEMEFEKRFWVHWGPVVSYDELELDKDVKNILYPKKRAKLEIDPWDTDPGSPIYYPSTANENNYAGKAFDTNLTEPPILNFNYYLNKATNTTIPSPKASWYNGGASSPWYGTGYLDKSSGEIEFNKYTIDNPNAVIFIEYADAKLSDSESDRTFMHVEALIIKRGNLHYHAWGKNPYTVNVPTTAWKQYLAGTVKGGINNTNKDEIRKESGPPDTAAVDEYPADAGLNKVYSTWQLPHQYDAQLLDKNISQVGVPFHGFLYSYEFDCSGGKNILVGSIKVNTELEIDTLIVYYDQDVAQTIKTTTSAIKRTSWKEVKRAWSDSF